MSPRLLVSDPSPVFRRSLRRLLQAEAPEWRIVGETSTASEVLDATRRLQPDVVLLERKLANGDGLQLISDLLSARPGVHVLMISFDWDPVTRRAALRAGARGVLLKEDAADHLVEALRDVGDRGEPPPGGR